MADFDFQLTAQPVLGGIDTTIGQTRIRERDDLAIVSIATPLGGDQDMADALRSSFGLTMPDATRSSLSGDLRAVRTAPDQMILLFPHDTPDAVAWVRSKLREAGYFTDQSDNWVALDVSGDGLDLVLERLSPVDLSAHAFEVNGSVRTVMEHLGVLAIRTGPDAVLLLSARSSAGSFLHAVQTSAAWV